jgi:hypothetical protein
MSEASRATDIENLAEELIELYTAQVADLREYAQAAAASEGTVNLERTLRHREVQRADLYRRFEQAAFPIPRGADLDGHT